MTEHKPKSYIRRAIKVVSWMFAGVLILIILAVGVLQLHGVQHFLAQKIVSSISEKTHTRIEVGSVTIGFTHTISLRNIFIEDLRHDTLLSAQAMAADLNLLSLLSHEIKLKSVRVDSLTTHIVRTLPDSIFNFGFILKALNPGPDSEAIPDTSTRSCWRIMLGGLSLNGLHITYDDEVSGINLRLQLGTLEVSLDQFDLDKKQFHVGELALANSVVSIKHTKDPPPDTSHTAIVDFRIGTISLANLRLNYENTVAGERYSTDLGALTLLAETIDLPSHRIALKTFQLDNTAFAVVQPLNKKSKTVESAATDMPWVISVDHLALGGNSAQYDVQGAGHSKGIDPNHLRLDSLSIRGENIYFSKNRMAADISHTSFREGAGFKLRELSGVIKIDSLHARLTDFIVETAASRIRQNVSLGYSSLSALRENPRDVNVSATIVESHIAISDVLYFEPSLPINNKPGASIRFSSRLSGLVRDLQVQEFRLATGDSTALAFSGSIRGLPNLKTAYYEVALSHFSSGRNDIRALVADTLLPRNIVLPASITMSGNFKGTTRSFSASSVITSSFGDLMGDVVLNSSLTSGRPVSRWKTDIVVEEFNVGALLNDSTTFGPVSLKASANGTGLSKDDIEAHLSAEVDKAVLMGYPYRRLTLEGTAGPKMFSGRAEIQDSNVVFTFNGTVNTSEENPTYKFTLDLKGVDLHRLNLASDDVRVAGIMTSDLTGRDINDINGTIDVRNVVIIKNGKRYLVDSLVYASVNTEGQTHIEIESPIFGGRFDGTIALGDLRDALKEHFTHYFSLQGKQHNKNLKPQAFTFQITLRDPAILSGVFFPAIHRLSVGAIGGNYDSDKNDLNVNIDLLRVDYNDFKIDSLALRVTSNPDQLRTTLTVGSIADSTFRVTNLQFAGNAQHDSMEVSLRSTRGDGHTKMLLAGDVNSVPEGYRFRFNKDGVMFQNIPWTVPADNFLLLGRSQLVAHNIALRGAGQSLSFNSAVEKSQRPPLEIDFNDFQLTTLSQIVERDSGLLSGVLNGNVVLQNLETQMAFTSKLNIKDFGFGRKLIGDIILHANNQTENVYEVSMDIAGNGNQITLQGKYRSEVGGSQLNFTCDFTQVNLASIEPFTFGKVQRLSGTMIGGLTVAGTMKNPSIAGTLSFTNTAFNPTFLDTYLHLNSGKITIDGKGIEFSSFDLVDTLGNVASLSGHLFTEDFRNFSYDFRVHADKFLLLNKPASRDALYYGTVIVDSDIAVKGEQKRPIVTMQAELDKGTDLALVLPESELAVEERRGIVRFVDVHTPSNAIMSRRNFTTRRDTTRLQRSSIDLTSNITVNKDAKLRILIDPVAGDSLVIQGEATFSFSMDPSGKLALTGRYEILGGSYQLSFGNFIKREFAIAQGSSLTWVGSPYDADVDITAIYTAKATVLDLVQSQLAGMSQEDRNRYKQALPIQVYLMLKGKLLTPDIHFRLDLPPESRGVLNGTVYAKLNELNGQESELNKQVFALLVLGRFISENPLASVDGNEGLSGLARSSVSQILSAQLNRLSQQYISGVNVNVGLESYQDYSSGNAEGRTQLQLALSKQLFDERVTVQVGGNVDLDGQRRQKNSLNNFAGDLKVLYKLTEDGRWQLQVFRQNSYEGAIDGDITKTGAGVVFTIDYDKLFGFTLKPVSDPEVK